MLEVKAVSVVPDLFVERFTLKTEGPVLSQSVHIYDTWYSTGLRIDSRLKI